MKFYISILSLRMSSGLAECVESVVKNSPADAFIRITSNGDALVSHYADTLMEKWSFAKRAEVCHRKQNDGFIQPNNEAFVAAHKQGYDVFVMLNDDAVVPPGWLDKMEAEFKRHPAAAIVGTRHTCCTLGDDFHGYEGEYLDYIDGSCVGVRVDVIAKHFASLFPSYLVARAYGEDASLSLEVRRLGYTIHQAPFHIEHRRGSTSSKVPEAKQWQAQNHAAMRERWGWYLKLHRFPRRIVLRRTAAVGDALLVSAILPQVWKDNPLSEIAVETKFPQLFEHSPYVAHASQLVGLRPDDLLIDLDNSYERAPMRHIVRSYAREAHVTLERFVTEVVLTEQERTNGAARLAHPDMVAIHAGLSTWPSKNWPLERWKTVIDDLELDGVKCVLVGAQINPSLTDAASQDLCAGTSLRELCAVLAHCRLLISIDSFPLHAAQAVGCPVVGLFGATRPEFILTHGSRSRAVCSDPMHPDTGRRHREPGTSIAAGDGVMRTIAVDAVLDAAREMLGKAVAA